MPQIIDFIKFPFKELLFYLRQSIIYKSKILIDEWAFL